LTIGPEPHPANANYRTTKLIILEMEKKLNRTLFVLCLLTLTVSARADLVGFIKKSFGPPPIQLDASPTSE